MSLIERAVKRIETETPTSAPVPPTQVSPATARPSAPELSSIERGFDRLRSAVTDDLGKAAEPSHKPAESVAPPDRASKPVPEKHVLPVVLDAAGMRRRGLLAPDDDRTPLASEFRIIKRPLIGNALGRGATAVANGRRIMVTSSLPGEGKTFCAVNLAISLATERDLSVLLVDADVARPSVPAALGIEVGLGLMDLLLDRSLKLEDVVLPTSLNGLSLLPAGTPQSHATELLASGAMNEFLDRLTARYPERIIVFDSPPLLLTTESRVLASHMGQIVMVVEAERTPQETVQEALGAIAGCEVVGLVLNKNREPAVGDYYGYYGAQRQ